MLKESRMYFAPCNDPSHWQFNCHIIKTKFFLFSSNASHVQNMIPPVPSMINTLTVSVKYFSTQMIVLSNSVRGPSNSSA